MLRLTLLATFCYCALSARLTQVQFRSSIIETDFESGTMFPWQELSQEGVLWTVENYESPVEGTAAPEPSGGSRYLRILRSNFASGTAILKSPVWTAFPGDELSLEFWMRSVHTGANTIEVYWSSNGVEERLLDLNAYSSPANFEWRRASAVIPVSAPRDIEIIIRGFCGQLLEDSVAIDNITVNTAAAAHTLEHYHL